MSLKWLLPILKIEQLARYSKDQVDLYIEIRDFSRHGTLELSEGLTLAKSAREKGFAVFLQLDLRILHYLPHLIHHHSEYGLS